MHYAVISSFIGLTHSFLGAPIWGFWHRERKKDTRFKDQTVQYVLLAELYYIFCDVWIWGFRQTETKKLARIEEQTNTNKNG